MNHTLKTDPAMFQLIVDDLKPYELRKDDRPYAVGDTLTQRETVHAGFQMAYGAPLAYTGRVVVRVVTHMLRGPIFGLKRGWVLMTCEPVPNPPVISITIGGDNSEAIEKLRAWLQDAGAVPPEPQ